MKINLYVKKKVVAEDWFIDKIMSLLLKELMYCQHTVVCILVH